MSAETVVLCFPVEPAHLQLIHENCGGRRVMVSNQDDILNDIYAADIFCGHSKKFPIDWKNVVRAGRLRWIQSSAAGLDHCLCDEIVQSEVQVSGCSGLFANQVAEHTLALLFALARSLPAFFRAQQNKQFERLATNELLGKTIGIVGFGGNGQRIAQLLRPFVRKILATDCFPDSGQQFADEILIPNRLSELLMQSDVVIVTLPQTAANEKLIDKTRFDAMKTGSYIINVGRGSVIDHTALFESLSNGRLAGAGLDVCDPEPLPRTSPLWDMENVLITPHVAAQSKTRVPMTVKLFTENLHRFDRGETLLNLVDKEIGFPRPEHRIEINSSWFLTELDHFGLS